MSIDYVASYSRDGKKVNAYSMFSTPLISLLSLWPGTCPDLYRPMYPFFRTMSSYHNRAPRPYGHAFNGLRPFSVIGQKDNSRLHKCIQFKYTYPTCHHLTPYVYTPPSRCKTAASAGKSKRLPCCTSLHRRHDKQIHS